VVTTVIFAQFGLEFLEGQFVYDTDTGLPACHSVVSCAFLIFYKGIPNGNLFDVMSPIDNRDSDYFGRIVLEVLFFFWVGIILFNIITGVSTELAFSPRARIGLKHSLARAAHS
jgi:hypothetical protein